MLHMTFRIYQKEKMLAGVQFQTDPSQATLTYFLEGGEVSKTPPHFSQNRRGQGSGPRQVESTE